MQIFHPVFDWWLGGNQFASRIFAFSEIRPSERSERAIPQSVIGGVGFLLKRIADMLQPPTPKPIIIRPGK